MFVRPRPRLPDPLSASRCVRELTFHFRAGHCVGAYCVRWPVVQSAVADLRETWSLVVGHCGVALDEA